MRNYEEYRAALEQSLVPMLMSLGDIPDHLKQPMIYSLEAGGKRIRPVLLMAACEMAGGDMETALPYACSLEMIHTYSLIHDDLPAMDNDKLRRGKPTNHIVFGENMAILAGDGLLNAAAELMAATAVQKESIRGLQATEIIMRHAGVTGMIAGQSEDVFNEGAEPREDLVRYIHAHKTADLLEAAVEAGLTLAGAENHQIRAGREYAYHLGMAFQMTDDLLDVIGDASVMGKNTHMDNHKLTWVALKGPEGTEKDAGLEISLAISALEKLPWDTGFFSEFAMSIIRRQY